MMEDLTWADIRQAFESAAVELRKVDGAWSDDAHAVAVAGVSLDNNRLRHMGDPGRLQQLRQALHIVEGLIDDMADADAT